MKPLLIATTNAGKQRELVAWLHGLPLQIVTLSDFPNISPCIEDGATLMENARKKARTYHAQTGLFTLADDSGLEVDALNGEPGVFSARFAGEGATDAERIDTLLQLMRDVPASRRTARFVCALAAYDAGHEVLALDGVCDGEITDGPCGAHGFGFDPIFRAIGQGRTFGEMSAVEKSRYSHRGKALTAARNEIRIYLDKQSFNALK